MAHGRAILYLLIMAILSSTQLLTVRDVARILRLNPLTVYGYIRSGKLTAAKFGRSYRISEEDLQNFIRSHTMEANHE